MNKTILWVIVGLVVFVGGAVYFLSQGSSSQNNSAPSVASQSSGNQVANNTASQKAADFTADKYDSSGKFNLASSYADKPTVIQFWATWCTICRGEFPANKEVYDKYKDKINYIAVDWAQGDKGAVKDYIKELGLDPTAISFVMDPDGSIGSLYGVRGTPTHVFIKKGGQVELTQTGGLSPDALDSEIQKIL